MESDGAFKRGKVVLQAGDVLMVVFLLLFLDLVFLVVCLEGLNREDMAESFIIFGYGQIGILLLFFLFIFLMGNGYRENNLLLDLDPVGLDGTEIKIIRNRKKSWTVEASSIVWVRASPCPSISRKKPFLTSSKQGLLIIKTRVKTYRTGYFADVNQAQDGVNRWLKAVEEKKEEK